MLYPYIYGIIAFRIKNLNSKVNKYWCPLYIEHSIQFYKAIEDKQDGVPSLEVLWSKVGKKYLHEMTKNGEKACWFNQSSFSAQLF